MNTNTPYNELGGLTMLEAMLLDTSDLSLEACLDLGEDDDVDIVLD